MALAYLYKWEHLPTKKWYLGSRTNKNAHPLDEYICSSNTVKKLIQENPHEWQRTIIEVSEDCMGIYDMETEFLQMFDAKRDTRSFNKHNNDGKWLTLPGTEPWNKNGGGYSTKKKGYKCTPEQRKNMSNASPRLSGVDNGFYGKNHTEDYRKKRSELYKDKTLEELYGKEYADKKKSKMSKSLSALHSTEEYKKEQSARMTKWWAARKERQNA